MPFLSFKGTTHGYPLKILMTNNKNRNLLLYLLNNCISFRSAPQILKDEYNFHFSNFLIIGLLKSSA